MNDTLYSFLDAYKILTVKYPYFVPKNEQDQEKLLDFWVTKLHESNIPTDSYIKTVNLLINLPDFSEKAPSVEDFINIYNEYIATESEYDHEFEELYLLLKGFYGYKFDNEKKISISPQYKSWRKVLSDYKNESIKKSIKVILDLSNYADKAPTLHQFVDIVKIIDSNEELPVPEVVFDVLMDNKENIQKLHPIMAHIKQKIGGWAFRTSEQWYLKNEVELVYRKEVNKYLSGELKLLNNKKISKFTNNEEIVSREVFSNAIDSIMINLSK